MAEKPEKHAGDGEGGDAAVHVPLVEKQEGENPQVFDVSSAETEKQANAGEEEEDAVHIVYVEQPEDEDPEAFHIRTIASVVGSEEVAKEKLVYSYTHAASGFAARLTPKQVQDISERPGVLHVARDSVLQLHSQPQTQTLSRLGVI